MPDSKDMRIFQICQLLSPATVVSPSDQVTQRYKTVPRPDGQTTGLK